MQGPITYGKLVTRARTAAGITQQELGKDINVKRETVSRWERDMLKVTPSAEEMHRLVTRLPELSEVQLLWSLHYNLDPLVDDAGRPRAPEGVLMAASLSDPETQLVGGFRRLSPSLQPVMLQLVLGVAAHLHGSPPAG